MPKIEERIQCWFFDEDCRFPIDKETMEECLKDNETTCTIPYEYTATCQNCLLAKIVECLLARKRNH